MLAPIPLEISGKYNGLTTRLYVVERPWHTCLLQLEFFLLWAVFAE
jgi:hypothetical protein